MGDTDTDLRFRLAVRFVSSLAHELRTALVPIRGYTRLLLEENVGPLNQTQQAHLRKVLEGANELVGATAPLVAVSTLETLQPRLSTPDDLMEGWMKSSAESYLGGLVQLERELSGEALLLADVGELRRALDEVLAYVALHLSDENGTVRIVCTESRGGKELLMRFSANAPGHVKLETAAFPELSMEARNVIRFHGGHVGRSEAPEGIEVVVSLPTQPPPSPTETEAPP